MFRLQLCWLLVINNKNLQSVVNQCELIDPFVGASIRSPSGAYNKVPSGASDRAPSSASFVSQEKSKSFSCNESKANDDSTVERVRSVPTSAMSFTRDISDSEGEDDYASFRGKKQSKKKTADRQESKRALAVSPSGSEVSVVCGLFKS